MAYISPIFLLIIFINCAHSQHWTYEEQPSWSEDYPSCAGQHQSPIEIESFKALHNPHLNLVFTNYKLPSIEYQANNTGHTIMLAYTGHHPVLPLTPTLSGSALNDGHYHLDQLHFHWGQNSKDVMGSEHSIDGHHFDMELHLVHYNRDQYPSYDEALKSGNGVMVLAMFFTIQEQNVTAFDHIIEMVDKVKNRGGNETIHLAHAFDLDKLLPKFDDKMDFFPIFWIADNASLYRGHHLVSGECSW